MNKLQKKVALTRAIIRSAATYKNVLVGNTFLYVFEGKHIEAIYRARDFLHLTGVETTLSAIDFYRSAVKGTLSQNEISFSTRHPYELAAKKVAHLQDIGIITASDLLVLEEITTNTYTYRFGLTDIELTLCLSQDIDQNGNIRSSHYIPRSLRIEDSTKRAIDMYEVHFIFKKRNDAKLYDTVTYMDSRKQISDIPEDIKPMLTSTLI